MIAKPKILLIDNDSPMRRQILSSLSRCGYEAIAARNGQEGIARCKTDKPDSILLDGTPFEIDELQILLREFCSAPVIVLSARNTQGDKIQALNAGAADYVTKPFDMEELLARINSVLRRYRRSKSGQRNIVIHQELEIDFERRCVTSRNGRSRLTPKELELLYLLVNSGQAVSHRKLLQSIWGPDYGNKTGYLRVFINHLRKKVEPTPESPTYILTEPYVGYRFAIPEA